MKNISILGATGSIGLQALEIIRNNKSDYRLISATANKSSEKIIDIINEFQPEIVALMDEKAYKEVLNYCRLENKAVEVHHGIEGLIKAAIHEKTDIVLTSVVGMIGLIPTLKAIEYKKDIALANKETLVVAGELVMREAKKNGVKILPVDSEHSAIFQCLQGNKKEQVKNIILTASGGPFRGKTKADLDKVTVNDALKHPKWNMGKKVSIDSATLMNKGLEVIEAHWLFNINYDNIKVVVHPQSIIHSMVEYIDGSIIAQMSSPDMKLPIQYSFNYPNRCEAVIQSLDFKKVKELSFEEPDLNTFKALNLAFKAGKIGGIMPTILNAANEATVDLFLNEKISFIEISDIIEEAMAKFYSPTQLTLENIIKLDKKVKEYVYGKIL